jgi:hypothetical protein
MMPERLTKFTVGVNTGFAICPFSFLKNRIQAPNARKIKTTIRNSLKILLSLTAYHPKNIIYQNHRLFFEYVQLLFEKCPSTLIFVNPTKMVGIINR